MISSGARSILITGASGFVGSHLVVTALAQGYDTWAAVRTTSSRRFLADKRINIIELNLNDPAVLHKQLEDFSRLRNGKGWDYVVHAAGATKARNEAEFVEANYTATCNLVNALLALKLNPARLVYISSLSAVEMSCGVPTGRVAPTAYGRSKFKAEEYLRSLGAELNSVILRPTGIYGPRERDYLLMIKSIDRHLNISVGRQPQLLSFVYVKDLCKAAFLALNKGKSGHAYQIADGNTYTDTEFTSLIKQMLHRQPVLHLVVPLWVLKMACGIGEWLSHLTGHSILLNTDKYFILKQRDWRCDISEARRDLGFNADYDLTKGLAETIEYYEQEQ